MDLYVDIGDASSSLRGSTSSFKISFIILYNLFGNLEISALESKMHSWSKFDLQTIISLGHHR